MQLSIEEVKKLDSNSYQIIDIRSEEEVAHGAIKGALNIQAEEIESDERVLHDKKLVIVCSRGKTSVDVAEYLTEKGFDAASLKGGYISWLLNAMKEDEVAERDIKADVEQSIRKKFKKSIWRKFTKAINTYELVKPGDKIAVCISGGKDSMLMAKLFQELKHHNKFDFEVKFLVMDPGYNEANRHVIEENCRNLGIPATIFESDIFGNIEVENMEQYMFHRRINRIGEVLNGVDFIEENYYKISLLNIPFTLYLREFLINNRLFFLEQTIYEDVDFYHRTIGCNPKMMIIDNIFYHRRYRQNSIMTSKVTETSIMNKINIYDSVMINSSDTLMKLYYMIGIRGIRKALQECKKNKINLDKKNIYGILKIIKNIDILHSL